MRLRKYDAAAFLGYGSWILELLISRAPPAKTCGPPGEAGDVCVGH